MTITGKRPKRAAWFELAEAASVGIEMAVAVAIGWFGGRWLEANVTHWPPTRWIGLAFGLGAAVMAVVRTVVVFRKTLEEGELTIPARDAAPTAPAAPNARTALEGASEAAEAPGSSESTRGSSVAGADEAARRPADDA